MQILILIRIYIYLCKAFNTVNDQILLDEFNKYGFHGATDKWLKSCVCNRTQFVCIKVKLF